jgi:hypothetical protein
MDGWISVQSKLSMRPGKYSIKHLGGELPLHAKLQAVQLAAINRYPDCFSKDRETELPKDKGYLPK